MNSKQPRKSRHKLDTQQIELIGRAHLETRLLQAGFEIARPVRDRGVDLITYCEVKGIPTVPIQLKAFKGRSFNIDKKYAGRGLVMAYVWYCTSERPELYLLKYRQAAGLLTPQQRGTSSWKKKGRYSITEVPNSFAKRLSKFKDGFHVLSERQ